VQALVRRVIEESTEMPNRNVHVEAEKVVVAVDPAMTEQMVEALLTNASGRTSSGDPVWITVVSDPEGAIVAVDDAEKIPDGLRDALSGSPQDEKDGAGHARLPNSLIVLQRLATVHGGRVWVEGREGGGASFKVLLPDVTDEMQDAAARQADGADTAVAG
jgi:K+-sensing histidine kinase KdpD